MGSSATSTAVTPDAGVGGYCEGNVTVPFAEKGGTNLTTPGIGFDARQQCDGTFYDQQVCVELQEKDSSGTWYKRTNMLCGTATTGEWSYVGKWVSCAGAGHGTFRTRSKGIVDTPYGVETGYATSGTATLC